jgi:hypothetical protein
MILCRWTLPRQCGRLSQLMNSVISFECWKTMPQMFRRTHKALGQCEELHGMDLCQGMKPFYLKHAISHVCVRRRELRIPDNETFC